MPKYYNPYTGQYEESYPADGDYQPGDEGYGKYKGYYNASRANEPALKDRSKQDRFNKDLARYDIESRRYRDELLKAFGLQTQTSVGLAQRGTQATVNQFLARRGVDATRGGLGASLQQSAQQQLQGQALGAQQAFSTQLLGLAQQQREAFVRGEFDFFRRIDLMGYEAELQKDILRFQQKIQNDLSFRDILMGVLGLGGQVVGSLIGGPVAGAAAGAAFNTSGYNPYSPASNQVFVETYGSPTYGY
jgi:hypothetical protein